MSIKHYKSQFGEWYDILKPIIESDFFESVMRDVENQYVSQGSKGSLVLPTFENVFRAFRETSPDNFKVLVLGQDPYPNKEHATGIAFGIPYESIQVPPSLLNLRNEIELSLGSLCIDFDITLHSWCSQGVLLLNSSLTVVEGKSSSHDHIWHKLTPYLIDYIVAAFPYHPIIVFGKKAESLLSEYTLKHSYVLKSPHPAAAAYGKSPGAVGSGVFTNCNLILTDPAYNLNKEPVIWDTIFLTLNNEDDVPY